MAGDLKRLKKKRGTVRTSSSKLINQIDELIEDWKDDNEKINDLEEMWDLLIEKEKTISEMDKEIEDLTEENDLEEELDNSLRYMDQIIRRKTRIKRILKAVKEDSGDGSQKGAGLHGNAIGVKLPKLVIERFSGDISLWQTFWSQFEAAIHKNMSISKIDKFNYLKSYVSGLASNVIAGLALTDDNYDHAIKMLNDRFGRKDLVINAHMGKLLNLNPVRRSHDIAALRKLYDDCEIQVRSLTSMGVTSDSYGSLLCPILMKLIPEDITLAYSREKDDTELSVKDLMTFLQREVESRERTANITRMESVPKEVTQKRYAKPWEHKPWEHKERREPPLSSTAALHTVSQRDGMSCIFCDKHDHKSKDCTELTVEQRREKVKRQGRCFICLGARHIARTCRTQGVTCERCGRRHHKAVCNEKDESTPVTQACNRDSIIAVSPCNSAKDTVLLQTATVWVETALQSKITRCLLDGGSQRSFIRQDISRALNLPVLGEETINVFTFGTETAKRMTCRRVRAKLRGIRSGQDVEIEMLETPEVCTSTMTIAGDALRKDLEEKGMQLADTPVSGMEKQELGILIGGDYYWEIVTGKINRINGALVALESKFGWLIQGVITVLSTRTEQPTGVLHVGVGEEKMLSDQLRSFWEIESLGIQSKMDGKMNLEDEETLQFFKENIKEVEGRYEVRLPWRTGNVTLSSNYKTAETRFNSLTRKFRSNSALYNRYSAVIDDYIEQKIVEKVECEETENPVYYLPHHAVIKEERSTSLRVVFDASSHETGKQSLNDCLLTGPNLTPDMLGILVKFRQHNVAVMSDITKAFLQISIDERDRDALRFLWTENLPKNGETQQCVMRMTRVPFGATTSPFLLTATIRHHLEKYEETEPLTVGILKDCLYVDDLISGAETVEDAYILYRTAKDIMSTASMDLCKWKTNSKELQDKWNQEQPVMETKAQVGPLKVLGISWRTDTDDFVFELDGLMETIKAGNPTKRSVLQSAARIFDPIGFLSPFTVRVKSLFQETWEKGLEWDDELPADLITKWQQWCKELTELKSIAIPRRYDESNGDHAEQKEIHVFCDASETAYCAAAYMRTIKANGCSMSLMASKTRVAPLKKITLPRLELLGALIGARLGNYLLKLLNMERPKLNLWTDSTITLHWIKSSAKQWKPFVANRVAEIQTLSEPVNWRHCSGKDNPADAGTRGESAVNLKNSTIWWHGPEWLRVTEDLKNDMDSTKLDIMEEETVTQNQVKAQKIKIEKESSQEAILDLKKYSRLTKVLRITAWVKRFLHNTQSKDKRTGDLSVEEMEMAERYWIKRTQNQCFSKEIKQLNAGQRTDRQSKISNLNPFMDEHGLLRVGGRLQKTDWTFPQKHPWILPDKEKFTELQVRRAHADVMHSGLQETLTQVRERFWVLKGRQVTKRIVNDCLICRRFKVKHGEQTTAPLPRDRLTEAPPFEVTGVDFAGPLYFKPNHQKAYIALFTCAVTRAVHLELVKDLSTDSFLLAFRRFISRRGICRIMYSDNAGTFKKASEELKALWNALKRKELKDFFSGKRIEWKFIVEKAAWWGGMWERMVRSVKMCLKKTLGKAMLGYEELQTLLVEVEAVVNSRPLTYVHTDHQDPSPLTPAHFLIGERLTALPPPTVTKSHVPKSKQEVLTKRWKYREKLISSFWNRWRKEYVMELRSAHTMTNPTTITPFQKDDLVLVHEHMMPRQAWKMGRVEEVFPGRDGKVRSCSVKMPTGRLIRRPVQLLYPMELKG